MKTQATKQSHKKGKPKEEKVSDNNPLKKWLGTLTPKKKIIITVSMFVLLLFFIIIPLAARNRFNDCDIRLDPLCELGTPVANTNDFIGKTIKESRELANRLGIQYEIYEYDDIYDPDSEDIQTVDKIEAVYDKENKRIIDHTRSESGLSLYEGWHIKVRTKSKTDKQLKDEEECKAKEGYIYDYKDGKVDCHKSNETLCKEAGKIYYKSKCYANQEEVDEAKRKEAEEEAKQEADKKAEEERKAKEEADKKAEEEAKKAEEKSKSESSSGSSSQSDGESLPDDIDPYDIKALCERTLKSVGYSNSISVTNHYAMGYPPYIYVIVGTLKGKDTVQCQANWSSWTVKSLTINGQKVYGE